MVKKIWAVSFSPAGGTKQVTEGIAKRIGESLGLPVECVDFTLPGARERDYVFSETDLVIAGRPCMRGASPIRLCRTGNAVWKETALLRRLSVPMGTGVSAAR